MKIRKIFNFIVIVMIFISSATSIVMYMKMLNGDFEKEITHYNFTTIREIEVFRFLNASEVCGDLAKGREEECPTTVVCSKSMKPEYMACRNNLTFSNMRRDFLNDELFKCYEGNNSKSMENLTMKYDKCIMDKDELNSTLNNITKFIKD